MRSNYDLRYVITALKKENLPLRRVAVSYSLLYRDISFSY